MFIIFICSLFNCLDGILISSSSTSFSLLVSFLWISAFFHCRLLDLHLRTLCPPFPVKNIFSFFQYFSDHFVVLLHFYASHLILLMTFLCCSHCCVFSFFDICVDTVIHIIFGVPFELSYFITEYLFFNFFHICFQLFMHLIVLV